jgi:hypothetical protein
MPGITQALPQRVASPSPSQTTVGSARQAIWRIWAGWYTRRIVTDLSDAQLRDAGIDRSAVLGDAPRIEVDAGVMRYLMSLR